LAVHDRSAVGEQLEADDEQADRLVGSAAPDEESGSEEGGSPLNDLQQNADLFMF
jgi:hypothetical protein